MLREKRGSVSEAIDGTILGVAVVVIGAFMALGSWGCSAAANRAIARGVIELAPEACLLLDPGHPELCTTLEDLKAIEPLLAAQRKMRLSRSQDAGAIDGGSADAPADSK